jgi:hypothetical protein
MTSDIGAKKGVSVCGRAWVRRAAIRAMAVISGDHSRHPAVGGLGCSQMRDCDARETITVDFCVARRSLEFDEIAQSSNFLSRICCEGRSSRIPVRV